MRIWLFLLAFLITVGLAVERFQNEAFQDEKACFKAFVQCHSGSITPSERSVGVSDERWDSVVDELFSAANRVAVQCDGKGSFYPTQPGEVVDAHSGAVRKVYWLQTGLRPELGCSSDARGSDARP